MTPDLSKNIGLVYNIYTHIKSSGDELRKRVEVLPKKIAVICKDGKFDKNSCRNNFEESVLQFIFLHWWQKAHSYHFLHSKHVSKTYFTEARFSTFPMIIWKKKKN